MGVVRWLPDADPRSIAEDQVLLVDSDAPTEALAIFEIQLWCDEYGLRRAPELHPAVVMHEGKLLRRGRCYRPTGEELRSDAAEVARVVEEINSRLAGMPMTTSSVELTRE